MCLAPVLLVFALLSPATSVQASEAKNCSLKQYASLDLVEPRGGLLLVPVTIQGSFAFMFLDTASSFSSITEIAVNRLALQTQQIPSGVGVRSGEKQVKKIATAKPFSLGNAQFKSADLLIYPSDTVFPTQGDMRVIGTLGMDMLKHFDIELDVANKKLNLFSQDHCPGRTVYWSKTYDSVPIRFGEMGELYFPMELDGKKIETTLATGNPTTSLSTDVTKKLFNFDSHSPDVETETDAAGRTAAQYRAMELSGEGLRIINAHIMLVDRPKNDYCHLGSRSGAAAYEGCFGVHPLQLGRNVLSKLHIYIATKEKVLYFTPAEAPK